MNASTTAVCLTGTALASVAYALRMAFEHDDLVDQDKADSGWARRDGAPGSEPHTATLPVPAPARADRRLSGSRLVGAV
jgi:hypothetical protein